MSPQDLNAFAAYTQGRYGLDRLDLYLDRSGLLVLDRIEVARDSRGSGSGSRAMQHLVDFADEHGLRMGLSTANPSDGMGTSSRARLVRFYKRFGFVENKGRSRDFSVSSSLNMLREPSEPSEPREQQDSPRLSNPAKTERALKPDNTVIVRRTRAAFGGAEDQIQVGVLTTPGKGFGGSDLLVRVSAYRLPGENVFRVKSAGAVSGWGPFGYDVLMEKVTELGAWLAPDDQFVSESAQEVWRQYSQRRDVRSVQDGEPRFPGDAAYQKTPKLLLKLRKSPRFVEIDD